jgi:hypothetical protein
MIRDRGNIKWQGFFLPEHKVMLQHLYEVEQHMVEKPILDEQKFEELNETILLAMSEKKTLHVSFYKDGFIKEFYGYITRTDHITKTVYFENLNEGYTMRIPFGDIVDLQIDWKGELPMKE